MEKPLDDTDWHILKQLQADGRLSYHELGRRVGMSAPSIAERVRRLEDAGIIAGYQARVDPVRAGLPMAAFLQLRCRQDRCLLNTTESDDYPEVVEIHKLSGEYCTLLKVRAASMEHLEGVIDRIGQHGELRTSVVLSTQFTDRPIEPPQPEFLRAPRSKGWNRAQTTGPVRASRRRGAPDATDEN